MKCIRNKKNGNIMRVDDNVANNMVGATWEYVSKDIWRQSKEGLDVTTPKPVAETTEASTKNKQKKVKA
jgi:hypothetical protein